MTQGDTLPLSAKLRVYAASGCVTTLRLSPETARDLAEVMEFAETMLPRFDALQAQISAARQREDEAIAVLVRCFCLWAAVTLAMVVLA